MGSCQIEAQKSKYLRSVGDIAYDSTSDKKDFYLCNERNIKQYHNNHKGLEYKGEKIALIELFDKQFVPVPNSKDSGLIRIRFIVNCKGETDRFRVTAMDENYKEKEFDTNATTVESQYFGDKGITNVVVYFSNDEQKIPVQFKFRTVKGEFIATVASIQNIVPEQDETQVAPTPKPAPTPFSTPKPIATPIPYKENQSLPSEFPFTLGEKLTFAVSTNGQTIANVNLHVKERKLLFGKDNVTFTAGVSDVVSIGKFFKDSDLVSSFNDPFSLTPNRFEIKLGSIFNKFNQIVQFDQNRGVVISGANSFEIPIGTYDLLSFAYAIRSFNLKPSKDPSNPVNDTRVAVFVGSKAVVFTLRPQTSEQIEFQGRKISAQKISFSTGNPKFDSLSPQLWLSNDRRRLPIKFSITYNGKVFNVQLINVTN